MSRNIIRHRQVTVFFSLIAATLLLGTASLAQAQNWNVTSGNWSVATNWNPADVPNNESPVITNGGTCTIADSDGVVGGPSVSVGPGAINMTGGQLTYPAAPSWNLTVSVRRGGRWILHPVRRSRYALFAATECAGLQRARNCPLRWICWGIHPERRLRGSKRHLGGWQ